MRKRKIRINPAYYFLAPTILGLGTFKVVPIAVAVIGSFMGSSLLGVTRFVGIDNYLSIFGDTDLLKSFGVTILFNVITNPLQIVCSLAVALLVFRPVPFVAFFRSALFLPVTMSIVLTALIWTLLFDPYLGPVNAVLDAIGIGRQGFFTDEGQALACMVWLATWRGVGYWMLFLLAGLYAIPESLHDAAKIDGASWRQRFVHITLPLMRRPIAFVLVSATAINMLFFAPAYVITAGGPNGATDFVMFRIYQTAFNYIDIGRSLAMSTVLLIVVLIIAMFELWLLRSED